METQKKEILARFCHMHIYAHGIVDAIQNGWSNEVVVDEKLLSEIADVDDKLFRLYRAFVSDGVDAAEATK